MHPKGVPAVGRFKSKARASWGKCQSGEVPVGGSTTWGSATRGKCQFGEVPVGGL